MENNVNIGSSDILEFWCDLYPELNSADQLQDILYYISNNDISLFIRQREDNLLNDNIKIFFKQNEIIESDVFKLWLDDAIEKSHTQLIWINFLKPILSYYCNDLYSIVTISNIIDDKKNFFCDLILSISKKLIFLSYKVLIFETKIAKQSGILQGSNSEERAEYFRNTLLSDTKYLEELYNSYPELIRLLSLNIKNYVNYIKEILNNTEKEHDELNLIFGKKQKLGNLKKIQFTGSDVHKGKFVVKLVFNTGICLMYKPRELTAERAYEKLTEWINSQHIPGAYDLKACKIHTVNNGGWMEYIIPDKCNCNEEIKEFYVRMGQLLCILYTLRASDFHSENLISQKGHPILIDLETIAGQGVGSLDNKEFTAEQNANLYINESVTKVSLLPTRIINHKNNKSIDIGGLSGDQKQEFPFKSCVIRNMYTDDVCVQQRYVKAEVCGNNPVLNGNIVKSEHYINYIKKGFLLIYEWIYKNKLCYIENISNIFKDCKCRLVLKPTNVYSQLLRTSLHPDLLHNSTDRLIYLHRLGLLYNIYNKNQTYKKIIKSELEDLSNGDIPYFSSKFDKSALENSDGIEIEGYYQNSIQTNIISRINDMDKEDLSWQMFFIDASYSSKCSKFNIDYDLEDTCYLKNDICLKNEIETALHKISDVILKRSFSGTISGKKNITFIDLNTYNNSLYGVCPTDYSLYNGNLGIGLYLACVSKLFDSSYIQNISMQSIVKIINIISDNQCFENMPISELCQNLYSVFKISVILNNHNLMIMVYNKIVLIKKQLKNIDIHNIKIMELSSLLYILYKHTKKQEYKLQIIGMCNDLIDIICNVDTEQFFDIASSEDVISLIKIYQIVNRNEINYIIQNFISCKAYLYQKNKKSNFTQIELKNMLNNICTLAKFNYDNKYLVDKIEYIQRLVKSSILKRSCSIYEKFQNLSLLYSSAKILNDIELMKQCKNLCGYLVSHFLNKEFVEKDYMCQRLSINSGLSGIGLAILNFYDMDNSLNVMFLD